MFRYLIHPKNWGIALFYALVRALLCLPYGAVLRLGAWIGLMAFYVSKKRRLIAQTNINACFKNLDKTARAKLLKTHFIFAGQSLFETAQAYWGSDKKLVSRYRIEGLEYLNKALSKKRGVLLLSAHFMQLDLAVRLLGMALNEPIFMMCRNHGDPFMDYLITSARKHYCKPIGKKEVKGVFKALLENGIVWYAPDQNFSYHMVFAPFFGVLAATVTGTSRIARESGCEVVPFFFYRDQNDQYVLQFQAALNDFPGGDDASDTTRINQIIEAAVKKHPEQYLWTHRRFKTRPQGELPFYPKKILRKRKK